MNCTEYREHASAPEPATQEVADAHRADCAACACWSQTQEDAVRAIDLPDVEPPPGDWERLSAALDAADAPGPAKVNVRLQCSYCHDTLVAGAEGAVYCASCLAPHHLDCFRSNAGCATPACPGVSTVTPVLQVHEGGKPWGATKTGKTPPRRLLPWLGVALLGTAALSAYALVGQGGGAGVAPGQPAIASTTPELDVPDPLPVPADLPVSVEPPPPVPVDPPLPVPVDAPLPVPVDPPLPVPADRPPAVSADDPPGTTYALVVGSGYDEDEAKRVARWLESSPRSPLASVERSAEFGDPVSTGGFYPSGGAVVWEGDPRPYFPVVFPLKTAAGEVPPPWATDSPGRYVGGPGWPSTLPFPAGSFERKVVLRAHSAAGGFARTVPFRRSYDGLWVAELPTTRDPLYGPDVDITMPTATDTEGRRHRGRNLSGGYPGHLEHQLALRFYWRELRGASPLPSEGESPLFAGRSWALTLAEPGTTARVGKPLPEAPRFWDSVRPAVGAKPARRELRVSSFLRTDATLLRAVQELGQTPSREGELEEGELAAIGPDTWSVSAANAHWIREQSAELISGSALLLLARWTQDGAFEPSLDLLRDRIEDRHQPLPWGVHTSPPDDSAARSLRLDREAAGILHALGLREGDHVLSVAALPLPDSMSEAHALLSAIDGHGSIEVVLWDASTNSRRTARLTRPDAAAASPEVLLQEGLELYEAFRYREAAARFRRVLELDPNHPQARQLLLKTELLSGDRAPKLGDGDPDAR